MKKSIIYFIITWSFCHAVKAQDNKQIDQYLSSVYQNHIMPGFSVVVTNKQEIFFSASYGFKDMGGEERFTSKTVNPIGSLTKSITALAILQLVEQGKIGLDDHVKQYIPEFTTANPERSDSITVRMLLNNTAGLTGSIRNSHDMSEKSVEGLLKNLSNSFILTKPGSVYQYSNIGFSIAGLLVSRVSGQPYPEYVRTNIFESLEMLHSSVLPINYEQSASGHFPGIGQAVANHSVGLRSGEFIAAGKYTESTTHDLANYLMMYLNKGTFDANRILSASLIEEMWAPQISFVGLSKKEGGSGEQYHYGLGWMISQVDGRKVFHHGGSTGTASSFTMIDPENELAVSLVTNVDLTLMDRHQYAFGLNIVNNILLLAAGNPTTSFAQPTEADPTINSFQLAKEKQRNYLGTYRYKMGGDNFVYYDNPNLIIGEEVDGLKGVIYRNDQIINEFILDFVNPSLAVSRNIASPSYIRFKINRKGKVSGVYCFGMELRKVDQEDKSSLRRYLFGSFEFSIPQKWILSSTEKGFTLSHSGKPNIKIEYCHKEKVFDPNQIGSTTTHRFNKTQWEKKSKFLEEGGSKKLITTFTTQLEGQHYTVKFTSNVSEHTYFLQREGKHFMEGIKMSGNGM